MVIWLWLENSNGIFHDPLATNWPFVFDTAIGWFIPSFFYISCLLAILQVFFISKNLMSQHLKRQQT
jgi:hypothetical protein